VLHRSDVLLYQTEVLTQPLEITGKVRANLWVSSDRVDTDFTAKLCDVYPDGRAMLICDGILRARHRLRMDGEDFLVPGEVVPITIDLWETAIVFNTGHRILLAVSSSNSPRFDPNPNTGEPFMHATTKLVAHNRVYHQSEYPSELVLPVLGAIPTAIAAGPGAGAGLRPEGATVFSGSTSWRLVVDSPGRIDFSIVDVAGRQVRRLAAEDFERGTYRIAWDGLCDDGRPAPSGLFRYVLRRPGERSSGTVVRVR
jgi:hypothetical protein